MFDELSSRFEDAVKGLRGEAKISENNINDACMFGYVPVVSRTYRTGRKI